MMPSKALMLALYAYMYLAEKRKRIAFLARAFRSTSLCAELERYIWPALFVNHSMNAVASNYMCT